MGKVTASGILCTVGAGILLGAFGKVGLNDSPFTKADWFWSVIGVAGIVFLAIGLWVMFWVAMPALNESDRIRLDQTKKEIRELDAKQDLRERPGG